MAVHLADPLLQQDAGGGGLFVGHQPAGRTAAPFGELGGFPEVEAVGCAGWFLLGLNPRERRGRQAQARS